MKVLFETYGTLKEIDMSVLSALRTLTDNLVILLELSVQLSVVNKNPYNQLLTKWNTQAMSNGSDTKSRKHVVGNRLITFDIHLKIAVSTYIIII